MDGGGLLLLPRVPLWRGKSLRQALKDRGLLELYLLQHPYNPASKFFPSLLASEPLQNYMDVSMQRGGSPWSPCLLPSPSAPSLTHLSCQPFLHPSGPSPGPSTIPRAISSPSMLYPSHEPLAQSLSPLAPYPFL